MTHEFNKGDKHLIMNTYQCFLKRMHKVIIYEVACSKVLGYNLGIKLAWGEDVNVSKKARDYYGPVWDTVKEPQASYDKCMKYALENLDDKSQLYIGSHSIKSVELAKDIIQKLDMKTNDSISNQERTEYSDIKDRV